MLKVLEISFRLWLWMWWRKIEARRRQNENDDQRLAAWFAADVTAFELGPAHTDFTRSMIRLRSSASARLRFQGAIRVQSHFLEPLLNHLELFPVRATR
jgi:hypothetical protein